MPTDFLSVLCAFQESGVRYVLVGGLAVLLHGIDRLTADIDLVVDLAPEQAAKAVETLLAPGFRANAPIDARQFADEAVRTRWQRESGMLVLSFWDPQNRCPTVDLFADHPMDFEGLYADSLLLPLSAASVRVAGVEHLTMHKTKNRMRPDKMQCAHSGFGSWQDAEDLRKWAFLQRSPQQRLDWLVQALTIAYECGALKDRAANQHAVRRGDLK